MSVFVPVYRSSHLSRAALHRYLGYAPASSGLRNAANHIERLVSGLSPGKRFRTFELPCAQRLPQRCVGENQLDRI